MTAPGERTPDSLGASRQTLRPKRENVVAGAMIAALAIIGGAWLSLFVYRQAFDPGFHPHQSAAGKAWAIALIVSGGLISVAGVYGLYWVRGLASFRLTISEDGFHFTRHGRLHVYAWEDIERVDEVRLQQRLPLANDEVVSRLMPGKSSRNYTVHRSDGESFYFDDNILPRSSLLAGPLAAAQGRFDFEWRTFEESE